MKIIINYRLDLASNNTLKFVDVETPKSIEKCRNKDEFLLFFCGKIYKICKDCQIYKNVQIMAPYLERPVRIKYMIVLPSDEGLILDASLKIQEIRKKTKELSDYFELAIEQNKSDINIVYAILLTKINPKRELAYELENEYRVKIMTLDDAIKFVKRRLEKW